MLDMLFTNNGQNVAEQQSSTCTRLKKFKTYLTANIFTQMMLDTSMKLGNKSCWLGA